MGIEALHEAVVARFSEGVRALLVKAASGEVTGEELIASGASLAQATGRQVVAVASHVAASHEPAPLCPECGRPMVRHDRRQRPLVTLLGEVAYQVQRWRCRDCRTAACPSYGSLHPRRQCVREVWEPAVTLCAHLPFEVAEKVLKQLGIHLSDNTLQRLTHEVGGERVAARQEEADAVMAGRRRLRSKRAVKRLYVMVDGFSARVEETWREPRAVVIFETRAEGVDARGQPPEAERVSMTATLADADAFVTWVTAETQRRGIWEADQVVLVADGASWIWERLRVLVPQGTPVVEILDWYHALENLAKAVRAAYGEVGNELEYGRLKRLLWTGQTAELLRRLRWLASLLEAEGARVVWNAVQYFRRHRDRLNYQALQLAGYHVGSGQVESACKRFGKRVRGAGQTWTEDGLKAVLCLLADDLTDAEVRREAA
jgi:hypothetical protein